MSRPVRVVRQDFLKLLSETGEMVQTKALGDAAGARTVRVRDGATSAEPGLLVVFEAGPLT